LPLFAGVLMAAVPG